MSEVIIPETFDFVLANELKRAARSQNYVTLVVIEPRACNRPSAPNTFASSRPS